ncbi:XRE family transcriptional regulator [Actinokineospora sp. HUAS TT18]|uniref:XRE family transcriptional regulator n=1 Tax=Actinokineospora sp. HUAS TT18 TaxID=3447451 RepID=UPI003F525F2C
MAARPFPEFDAFPDALRAAIQARGLGLERIRNRLRTLGAPVSIATLSYWQSGRCRPERPDSLIALAHLESVLEVPAGSLISLLGPPRPRGRWLTTPSVDIATYWPDKAPVREAVRAVNSRWDQRLTRLSQHDLVTVGPDRDEQSIVSRQVLRADADGPDRWVVIMHIDDHDRPLPVIRALRNCAVGRSVLRPGDGLLVTELLFERPLARGETVITEHEMVNQAPCPLATNYERKFRRPVREFVVEVAFHPSALPVRCEQFSRVGAEAEQVNEAVLDGSQSVHSVALNFGPGVYGYRWEWASS